jgi:hypothetical protein
VRRVELAADSPELRLELTYDDEAVVLLLGVLGAGVRRRLRERRGRRHFVILGAAGPRPEPLAIY